MMHLAFIHSENHTEVQA